MSAKIKKTEPEGYLVGYARVSTRDQSLQLQIDALRKAGVQEDNLHVEQVSGASKRRPALDRAIKDLEKGDTLVVWRIDRFSRSMRDLFERLDRIYAKGAQFRSLTESFDFNTMTGRFVLGVLALAAELERQITIHRTKAGIEAIRSRGDGKWGRAPSMTPAQITQAGVLLNKGVSGPKVAERFKVSTATIYANWKLNRTGRGKKFIRRPAKT